MAMEVAYSFLSAAHALGGPSGDARADAVRPLRDILVICDAGADGAAWREVREDLTARGYRVSIIETPQISFTDDVAATRRVLASQEGPCILVGHGYGGSVITETGADDGVAGLVYVAAFAPDIGQSTLDQGPGAPRARRPARSAQADDMTPDQPWRAAPECDLAADASLGHAPLTTDALTPVAMAALHARVTAAAWQTRPSWYVIATEDVGVDPGLQRRTAARIGATTTEITGGRAVLLSQPKVIADVIDRAAHGARGRAFKQ